MEIRVGFISVAGRCYDKSVAGVSRLVLIPRRIYRCVIGFKMNVHSDVDFSCDSGSWICFSRPNSSLYSGSRSLFLPSLSESNPGSSTVSCLQNMCTPTAREWFCDFQTGEALLVIDFTIEADCISVLGWRRFQFCGRELSGCSKRIRRVTRDLIGYWHAIA